MPQIFRSIAMYKTRHLHKRLNQRGIPEAVLEILSQYGISRGDKKFLDIKNCLELSDIFAHLKKITDKMAEKGGYTLVATEEALITVYRLDSYSKSKARNK